ncbi:hypothetical protein SCEN_G02000 [Saccharomyces cerevisiae]|uniref:Putative uncharacterized protein YGL072C n=3 Tax=Saccharomyces cerevisiae TaxID=4932 RepID=YGH2_YEAST|nr:RecName: Full=Putative uncharacterized protein YGL072C [Saccharomyces cerevisiae S288C]AAT93257.1 YGL072C [Saccharomyces cerevisiae]EDZ72185.1 hypothetical protein AWRI1631_71780 [Saccharomyces cerevisiae AWRI1631]CAY79691.1 EC1118_1G1_2179p [Saccharomyces cerevisiae EC1118]KZV11154.1 hypothetical protein WN66_02329 [Saccharomyces cerevisiae]QHB08578.1 hypothetical protein SCEN_G02000 [Saccharomyces cerevisiae]
MGAGIFFSSLCALRDQLREHTILNDYIRYLMTLPCVLFLSSFGQAVIVVLCRVLYFDYSRFRYFLHKSFLSVLGRRVGLGGITVVIKAWQVITHFSVFSGAELYIGGHPCTSLTSVIVV